MEKAKKQVSLKNILAEYLNRPLWHPTVAPIILIFTVAAILIPLVPINDWWLNTKDLSDGFEVYQNPDFVYPPWSLAYLWIYRFMSVSGSRIVSIMVLTWLVIKRGWTLKTFLAMMLNPFLFITLLLAGIDILVVVLPLLLWEVSEEWSYGWISRGFALSILVVKPQIIFLVLPYLAWRSRHQWKQLLLATTLTAIITIPISFTSSPVLLLQWLSNIQSPSEQNSGYWQVNNMSLTHQIGFPLSLLTLISIFGIYYLLRQKLGKTWTHDHTIATLIICSTLLSPYASMQSLIGGLAFAPSFIGVISQYIGIFGSNFYNLYISLLHVWIILFALIALWFIPTEDESKKVPPDWRDIISPIVDQ